MPVIYGILTAIALALLVGYCQLVHKKDPWLLLLFCCVPVVNVGYFMLSLATAEGFALFANGVAYFGSVFLILCMFMVILRLCGFIYPRWVAYALLGLALLMFGVVCSPWYYLDVTLATVDGATKLIKEYGPLHPLYLVYLLGYFAAMIVTIFYSRVFQKKASRKNAVLMAGIVLGNIAFWMVEKFVSWNFEFLSVSYLFSEVILLGLYWMMQDYVRVDSLVQEDRAMVLIARLPEGVTLHPREREILYAILDNKKRRDIAEELSLSENTVKTYTRSLYRKLGVYVERVLYPVRMQLYRWFPSLRSLPVDVSPLVLWLAIDILMSVINAFRGAF